MDLIKEHKLKKNILHWYPNQKNKKILQIGYVEEEIIEELCEKFNKVVIIVNNEEQKKKIKSKLNAENLEIITDFAELKNNKFDYISLIGTMENYEINPQVKAHKKLQIILDLIENYIEEESKILLVIDNQYGMKFWTTLQAQKNILCNQNFALSKRAIEKIFKRKGFENYKYYYVLPDYKAPNVIFTDNYLPNFESIHRDFLYGEEEYVNFNEVDAYIEILKEDPKEFTFFANSYFIEISKRELEENNIKFVSFTNLRKKQYKIQTIIYNENVEKTNLIEESRAHIENMKKYIDIMKNQNIKTVDKYENGKIISKFIENGKSYDKFLIELLEKEKNKEFFEHINNFKQDLLTKLEKVEYSTIKENNIFTKNNLEYNYEQQPLTFIKYGLWDLIFQNAFYIDNELYFYDQEWFDENVPIEFIIYRAIAYFPTAHAFIKTKDLYKTLGLEKYLELFQELDIRIQKNIRDEEMWNIHNSTKTGQTLLNLYHNKINELENYKPILQNTEEEVEKLTKEKAELERRISDLLKEREIISNSTSWKITKPMRWINGKLKR